MKKVFIAFMMMAIVATGFTSCIQESQARDTVVTNETDGSKTLATNQKISKTTPKALASPDLDLPKTSVKFNKTAIAFGDVKQGDKVSDTVTFTNTGNEPLIISSAKGSCGCTVPKWPKAPVAPGESAEMIIEFSSKGKSGQQNKTVTIQANTDPNPIRLTVKANVLAPKGAVTSKVNK